MKAISWFGKEYGIFVKIGMAFVLFPRSGFLSFLGLIFTSMYVSEIMKALVMDPRPFMSDYWVYSPECSLSYGNPSVTSAYAGAAFPGFIYLTVYYIKKRILYIAAIPIYVMCFIFTVMIPYSRFHLGANSIDQILTGGLIGVNSFLFMVTTWHKPLKEHIEDILEKRNTKDGGSNTAPSHPKNKKALFLSLFPQYICLQLLIMGFAVIVYFIAQESKPMSMWSMMTIRHIWNKCSVTYKDNFTGYDSKKFSLTQDTFSQHALSEAL